jgi:hypothetical protein
MKNIYTIILAVALFLNVHAQTPQGFNYQGVARSAAGVELVNQAIGIQIAILDGSPTGTAVYTETHALTTDANGLFTLTIGGGTATVGTFAGINWAVGGGKWLQVSMDATGGTAYQLLGSSQLLSVPYALFAGNVVNNGGKQTLVLSDDVTDAQAAAIIAAEVGPNTQEIKILGTTNLTTVNLSMITTAINIEISNNTSLVNVDLSGLVKCDGYILIGESPQLVNLNLSALSKITSTGLNISNIGISSLALPNLSKLIGELSIRNNQNLATLNLPNTNGISFVDISDNPILSTINLSSLSACKNSFTISDNSLLSSINFNSLSSTADFTIQNNLALSTFSFPQLTILTVGCRIRQNAALANFSFPLLASISNTLSIETNALLSSISLPLLNSCGNLFIGNNASLTSFTLPVITSGSHNFSTNNALMTVSFPNLTSVGTSGGFNFNNHPVLASVNLPVLAALSGFQAFSCPGLTTINLPLLSSIGNNNTSNNTSSIAIGSAQLTNFSLPALTSLKGGISMSQNKLTSADVNGLLAKLVALSPSITGRFIGLSSQTPPAPPTGQGLTDKSTLIANGNSVSTD